jgi:hypothetical protein
MDAGEVGVPGVPERYYRTAVVDTLPASATDMYAVYESGERMCVYRGGQWWCSPTELVVEVLGL